MTGATGKVGQTFLPAFLAAGRFAEARVVALCNNRMVEPGGRIDVVQGSLSDAETVRAAMRDTTHVLHMAAVKESPDLCIDVALKGMFQLLEAFRQSPDTKQFILIGGDCSVGHIFHFYPGPVTEGSPRRAYPGCYALTKVLEEVMLEQYQIQYGVNGCILRAPWIMEKDDFRFALSFGPDQFGGPSWSELMPTDEVDRCAREGLIPLMLDRTGHPLRRNFVHVDDLVAAILAALDSPDAERTMFNIAMNEPVDYARAAARLKATRGLDAIEIETPFHSNWLDNAKARLTLGWKPSVDLDALIERAWSFERKAEDPRKIWYPG